MKVPDDVVRALRAAGCVLAEQEAQLIVSTARTPAEVDAMVDRRAAGLPLEHVLGWAEFCGLRIAVDPEVFVPRRRTEFLVRQAATLVDPPPAGRAPVVVDLCCGSGALGLALAAALGGVELHAADIDSAAVVCARRNVVPAGGHVYKGDLFEPLPVSLRGRVDVLLANVPYVPTDAIQLLPREARLHEPSVALDGGTDGLEVLRRVAAGAPEWLAPGGHLLVEASEHQAPVAVEVFTARGLVPELFGADESGSTVVVGSRPRGSLRTAPATSA